MQTVFTNHMVEHVWAQQSQARGRSNNGNYSFEGPLLYSYSTPIAAFVTGTRGRRFVLITSETFSVTTSGKHMPSSYNIPNIEGVFRVPFIAEQGSSRAARLMAGRVNEQHSANAQYLFNAVKKHAASLSRMHVAYRGADTKGQPHPHNRCEALRESFGTYKLYCEAFGIRKDVKANEAALERLCDSIHAAYAKWIDPKAIARREKAREGREGQREQATVAYRAWTNENGPLPTATQRRLLPYSERMHVDRTAQNEIRGQQAEDWKNGARFAPAYHRYPMLRLKPGNPEIMQTSMGAEVPLTHAIKAFRFAKLIVARGHDINGEGGWTSNGTSVRVGHFNVTRIDVDGTIKAGCHIIPWEETKRFAQSIGVFDQAADETALEAR